AWFRPAGGTRGPRCGPPVAGSTIVRGEPFRNDGVPGSVAADADIVACHPDPDVITGRQANANVVTGECRRPLIGIRLQRRTDADVVGEKRGCCAGKGKDDETSCKMTKHERTS